MMLSLPWVRSCSCVMHFPYGISLCPSFFHLHPQSALLPLFVSIRTRNVLVYAQHLQMIFSPGLIFVWHGGMVLY